MGDKSTARDTMKNAGVPTVPGSDGLLQVLLFYLDFGIVCQCILGLQYQIFFCLNTCVSSYASFKMVLAMQSTEEAVRLAEEIGFPVMIKVSST